MDGDEVKLTQVIYNLITNAVNYSEDRKEIIIHQEVKDGIYHFAVQDFGNGIKKDMLPYVWDRYYRGTYRRMLRAKLGSGIGLSIVKGILELHQRAIRRRKRRRKRKHFLVLDSDSSGRSSKECP